MDAATGGLEQVRPDGRALDALRDVTIERNYTKYAEGSVLVSFGETKVLCTATVERQVPAFLRDSGSGWVTAEYAMLPRSAQDRIVRDSVKKGRAMEISRLIGRSLRSVVDLGAMGERQIVVDCDVLQADGGTRTASITGGYVALRDALDKLVADGVLARSPLVGQCAAVSVGIVGERPMLDLCYVEDSAAEVDLNLVMRRVFGDSDGACGIVEVQGTAERQSFSRGLLNAMLDLGERGIVQLMGVQNGAPDHG